MRTLATVAAVALAGMTLPALAKPAQTHAMRGHEAPIAASVPTAASDEYGAVEPSAVRSDLDQAMIARDENDEWGYGNGSGDGGSN